MFSPTTILFALAFFVNSFVAASPPPSNEAQALKYYGYRQENRFNCSMGLQQRREWRTLSNPEKADYISAVKCLQAHPSRDPAIPEARTRFDEFQAHHIMIADKVHNLGQFLPWHRHYLRSYEKALRNECGYNGSFPYWDWTQDVGPNKTFADSPVYDPVHGFGGNGAIGTYTLPQANDTDNRIFPEAFRGCVVDGPFANLTLSVGPGKLVTTHCLTRGDNEDAARKYLNAAAEANVTRSANFEVFRVEIEGEPVTSDHRMHDGGHDAIGGEMSNFYSSPGEPLFYLHHANLDRIWWKWQSSAPSRVYEISGPSSKEDPSEQVTLDFILLMGSLGPSVTIRDVMDIHAEPNCYTYV
ncbi:Tyrosinase P [Psilocybe cubensis]|uniref:Tyrosinase copper-binding domain-containing protein n=2 Tax=Psilocybe cubensis TaxID=181762 RepID=A0A8H7Y4Q9_PSICU|nr:Tyrosinase P [Psilocybe cubensis]KAH9484983.1 Tyrosinase P [Psilocybe cubensis]